MNNFVDFNNFKKDGINAKSITISSNASNTGVSNPVQSYTPPSTLQDNSSSDKVELSANNATNPIASNVSDDDLKELDNALIEARMQNGIVEKISNFVKNKTKHGFGSDKLEAIVNDAKQGKVSKEDALNKIKEYRRKQENTRQAFGDIVSVTAAAFAFFAAKNTYNKKLIGPAKINKTIYEQKIISIGKNIDNSILPKFIKNKFSKWQDPKNVDRILSKFTSKNTMVGLATIPAMLVGGIVKKDVLKLNRIGSKQYKPNITDDMSQEEKTAIKKAYKKEKKSANRRNMLSGMINGITMPIMGFMGAFGTPLYLAANSLNRYFMASKEDKGNKKVSNYINNLKESKIDHIVSAAIMAVPLIYKGAYSTKLEKSVNSAVDKLNKTVFAPKETVVTAYQELDDILLKSDEIKEILNSQKTDEQKILDLYNNGHIFALKFLQIKDGARGKFSNLAKVLKENCPIRMDKAGENGNISTEIAQSVLDKSGLKGKYTIQRYISSGTVAETYLAKDEKGKEVVAKIIHDGISKESIENDANRFIEAINNSDKTQTEKEYLIRNFEGIKNGILEELNLSNEMVAAQELAKVTKKAKLVQPIEATQNAYIMKKADGVSLRSLNEFMEMQAYNFKSKEDAQKIIEKYADSEKIINELLSNDKYGYFRNKFKEDYVYVSEAGYIDAVKKYDENLASELNKIRFAWNDDDISQEAKELYEQIQKSVNQFNQNKNLLKSKREIDNARNFIKLIEENPGLEELTPAEATRMLTQLNEIINEQFVRVNSKGNPVHADIHSGNIFIDISKLKNKGKNNEIFTLIDTGNVIHLTQDQAIRSLNLQKYIKNADAENIAKFVIEGATLPEGMKKEEAYKYIYESLKQLFFDTTDNKAVRTGKINNETILAITDNLMKKKGIIPSANQGNLLKARTSAKTSVDEMMELYINRRGKKTKDDLIRKAGGNLENASMGNFVSASASNIAGATKDMSIVHTLNELSKGKYEKANLSKVPLSQRLKFKKGKGTPKSNSEERIIYELKQKVSEDMFKGTVFEDIQKYADLLEIYNKYSGRKIGISSLSNEQVQEFGKDIAKIIGKDAANRLISNQYQVYSLLYKISSLKSVGAGIISSPDKFEKAKLELLTELEKYM